MPIALLGLSGFIYNVPKCRFGGVWFGFTQFTNVHLMGLCTLKVDQCNSGTRYFFTRQRSSSSLKAALTFYDKGLLYLLFTYFVSAWPIENSLCALITPSAMLLYQWLHKYVTVTIMTLYWSLNDVAAKSFCQGTQHKNSYSILAIVADM